MFSVGRKDGSGEHDPAEAVEFMAWEKTTRNSPAPRVATTTQLRGAAQASHRAGLGPGTYQTGRRRSATGNMIQ